MRYDEHFIASLATSGTTAAPATRPVPWQPSTWPVPDDEFVDFMRWIIDATIIGEIRNVIQDAQSVNGSLQHRGHVISLAMLCAVDTLASYAINKEKVGERYIKYVQNFFPVGYQQHAKRIYKLYRNSQVHSWHLFEVGIFPGNEPIENASGTLYFGLLNFFTALERSAESFIAELQVSDALKRTCIARYNHLRNTARP